MKRLAGTVNLWPSDRRLVECAYRDPDHRRVFNGPPAEGR